MPQEHKLADGQFYDDQAAHRDAMMWKGFQLIIRDGRVSNFTDPSIISHALCAKLRKALKISEMPPSCETGLFYAFCPRRRFYYQTGWGEQMEIME